MNALHQDGFCWKKLHDGAILIDPEHVELAERRLSSAPELLEACKAIGINQVSHLVWSQLQTAIAKTRREKP